MEEDSTAGTGRDRVVIVVQDDDDVVEVVVTPHFLVTGGKRGGLPEKPGFLPPKENS